MPDGRVTVLVLGSAVAGLLSLAVVAGDATPAPLPALELPASDAGARRALLELVERGAETSARVVYMVERDVGADELTDTVVEVNLPPDRLRSGFGTLDGVIDGEQVACTTTAEGPDCLPPSPAVTGPEAGLATLDALTSEDPPWYTVEPIAGREVAGESARCFRIEWTGVGNPVLMEYGTRSDLCFAADGVVLASVKEQGGTTTHQRATSVSRTVTGADFAALLTPFTGEG